MKWDSIETEESEEVKRGVGILGDLTGPSDPDIALT